MLMPIITKKRAHHLFIKRPATIANPATPVATAAITISIILYHDIAKDNKGVMCNHTQTNGIRVNGQLVLIHNKQANNNIRTAHTKYVQTSVLI